MKRVYLVIPVLLIAVVITSQVSPHKAKEKSEIVSPPLPPEPPPPPPPPPPFDETVTISNELTSTNEAVNFDVPPPPPPAPPLPAYEENFQ